MKNVSGSSFNVLVIIYILILILFMGGSSCFGQEKIKINGEEAKVSCSSFCDEYEDIQFGADRAFNGDPERPWMSANKFDPKTSEWVKIEFAKPVAVAGLRITPGFGHGADLYNKYSRIKKFRIIFDGGGKSKERTYFRQIDNSLDKDIVAMFSSSPKVSSITFKILDIYPGTKGTNPLIGEIDPLFIKDGKIVSSSQSEVLRDIFEFIRCASSPQSALSFIPLDKPVNFTKIVNFTNPLDNYPSSSKKSVISRAQIKKDIELWKNICKLISYDYQAYTYDSLSYIRKDKAKGQWIFDMFISENPDVISSYTLYTQSFKVKETARQSDSIKNIKENPKKTKKTDEKLKTVQVTRIRNLITSIFINQDIYTP
jgi:hypothetical protein